MIIDAVHEAHLTAADGVWEPEGGFCMDMIQADVIWEVLDQAAKTVPARTYFFLM